MINRGVRTFIEIGPGKVLSSLVKRTAESGKAEVNTYNIENMDNFKQLLNVELGV